MQIGLVVHTVIINNKNQVLVLERSISNDVLPGLWDIPGGTLEDGEDPATGAVRETKEEAGININNLSLFFYTSNIDKKNKQFVRLIFIAKYQGGEIVLNPKEHSNYKWIKINEISSIKPVDYLVSRFDLLRDKEHGLLLFS